MAASEQRIARVRHRRRQEAERQRAAATAFFERFKATGEGAQITQPAVAMMDGLQSLGTLLPPPCLPEQLQRAESRLGFMLPQELRQLYLLVGNGGFGPANSAFEVERVAGEYRDLMQAPAGPGGQFWPATLLPFAKLDQDLTCIDVVTGRIIDWQAGRVSGRRDEAAWAASFREAAPDLGTWLMRTS